MRHSATIFNSSFLSKLRTSIRPILTELVSVWHAAQFLLSFGSMEIKFRSWDADRQRFIDRLISRAQCEQKDKEGNDSWRVTNCRRNMKGNDEGDCFQWCKFDHLYRSIRIRVSRPIVRAFSRSIFAFRSSPVIFTWKVSALLGEIWPFSVNITVIQNIPVGQYRQSNKRWNELFRSVGNLDAFVIDLSLTLYNAII